MTHVLIVGAGPVGLTAALLLAQQDIYVILVDPKVPPVSGPPALIYEGGSRAVVTQRSSLDVWQPIPGVVDTLLDLGITWKRKETWWGNRRLSTTDYQAPPGLPPFLNVPQPTIEATLRRAIPQYPGVIAPRWGHRVNRVVDLGDQVMVSIEDPKGGYYAMSVDYLIGADGGGSTVRDQAGIIMPRKRSRNTFTIADVHDTHDRFPFDPTARRYYFDPPGARGTQLLVMPQPGGVWRIDWQTEDDEHPWGVGIDGLVEGRVQRLVGAGVPFDVLSTSRYWFENNVADQFTGHPTNGHPSRVALIGDAAHRFSPFGGRGMNSGIRDAALITDTLTHIRDGHDVDLLTGYGNVARAHALVNAAATSRVLEVLEAHTRTQRATRAVALLTAPWCGWARTFLDTGPYRPDPTITEKVTPYRTTPPQGEPR